MVSEEHFAAPAVLTIFPHLAMLLHPKLSKVFAKPELFIPTSVVSKMEKIFCSSSTHDPVPGDARKELGTFSK